MRLTVNLEPDLYAVAKSLAKADDCRISYAATFLSHCVWIPTSIMIAFISGLAL